MKAGAEDQFDVQWNMQYHGGGPVDAVRQALGELRDPEGTATCFTVTNMRTNERWVIDIEEPSDPLFLEGTPTVEPEE